ncbi:MAG: hypothetical protein ABEJ62_01990 [Candidatus Nanohaloarchaea archaeon]
METRFLVLAGLAVLVAGCTQGTGGVSNPGTDSGVAPMNQEVTVEITPEGFRPRTVTVENGTTVTWVNRKSGAAWPASSVHPTHTRYPGGDYGQEGSYLGSQACTGKGEQKGHAFDACQRLQPGDTFSFTFKRVGTWGYHDHLNPSVQGTVKVVER